MFDIKTDIPAPEPRQAGRPGSKYPFGEMRVGASFFVPVAHHGAKTVIARVRTNLARWKKTGVARGTVTFRIAAHPHPDTQEPSIGVWRTE